MAFARSPGRRSGQRTGSPARRIGLHALAGLLAFDAWLIASGCAPHTRDREDDAATPPEVSAPEHPSAPAPTLVHGAPPPTPREAKPSEHYELVREPIGTGGLGERVRWAPRVRIGRASPDGAAQASIARHIVQGRLREIVACYVEGLRRDPRLHGELVLRLRIGRKGGVWALVEWSPALARSSVLRCAARRVRRWRVAWLRGAPVTIAVPVVLGQSAAPTSAAFATRVMPPPQNEPAG